ncbi:TIGR00341 family protein [Halohasta salina]|uniref:TIGR00341 family protein n=1 Tax=Halohasta salina TaxID=2961621 RepID=UPI0020A37AFA|nr:TIGR00341 family protein [Halohasta salina]
MRLIQTLIPEGKRETVIDILEDEEVDFAMTEESSESGYSDILYIPAESDAVEAIVDDLRSVGVEREGYMVISDVETIVSEQFEEQQAENEESGDDERISREELRTKARGLSRSTTNYLVLTIISAIVATAGLLQDSAAVVVGSMVIAPLIGPAMASCVGTVINDDDNALFWEGVRSQVVGLVVAVLSATLFAAAYRFLLAPDLELLLIQQVAERAHPGLLALAIALGAGTAGALSLTSGADEALVGVMIAVALMPPAASVGLGIAYVDPRLAVGAGILVLVNLLSINVAGILTIWVKRYRPTHWYDAREAKRATVVRLAVFGMAVLLLTSFLAVSSLDARDNMAFEAAVEGIAEETTDGLLAVDIEYRADLLSQQPSEVTIHVSDETPPAASEIRDRIRERTGLDVSVTVITEQVDTA